MTDPHVAWSQQAAALAARMNAGDLDDATFGRLGAERSRLYDAIADTPATTLPGAVAQLRVVLDLVGSAWNDPPPFEDMLCHERALRQALTFLEVQAGA